MLNIGFIGFGKSATRYHLPYLLNRKNKFFVKKIFSPEINKKLIKPLALDKTEFCQTLDELLSDETIEMIAICTPPTTHYDLAMRCLEAGKNILVEKPFCTTVDEAEKVFSLANHENLVAMPYQNRRFDSEVIAAKEVLNSGKIGDVFEAEFHFDRYRPRDNRLPGSKYDGEFYGLGVHLLDKAIYLFGIPDKVFYDIKTLRKPENADDTFEMQLFYKDKKVILKVNQLIISEYPVLRLNGTLGSLIKYGMDKQEEYLKKGILPDNRSFGIDYDNKVEITHFENDRLVTDKIEAPVGDYGKIYDNLYDVIKNGSEKLVSDDDTIANIRILSKGIDSDTPILKNLKDEV